MNNALLVGAGGFIGSVARYWLSSYVQQISKSVSFPYGTLTVNLLGCLVIGVLAQLADSRGVFTPEARAFVFIGILGGFTTFSSFGNETINLFRGSENLEGIANVIAHIVLGLGAVWLGRVMVAWIWK
ncbi:MAG: fluoride efflux transporter CrcB [Chloroflexi bacterium]|nr:fluoride efflux transporter CrcB [Chloroflexota bacterium]MBI5349355.1 fluoride efflux transporter CrcB [Chloroflexota bacterium]